MKKLGAYITIFASDLLSLILSFLLAYVLRDILSAFFKLQQLKLDSAAEFLTYNWWIFPLYFGVFAFYGLYGKKRAFWQEVLFIFKSIFLTSVMIFAFISLSKLTPYIARTIMLIQPMVLLATMPLIRRFVKILLWRLGLWRVEILEIRLNTKRTTREIFNVNKFIGYTVKDSIYFDLDKINLDYVEDQVKNYIKENRINTIVIVAKRVTNRKTTRLMERLYFIVSHILMVPTSMSFDVINADIYHFMYNNYFVFDINKGLISPFNKLLKRIIDIIGASVGLILSLPLFLIVGILTVISDGLPILYTHERYGFAGKVFKFFKFRSMFKNNDVILKKYLEMNPSEKLVWDKFQKIDESKDPRIIKPVGYLLRKSSLDEIPQLINVLLGQMSLVGPRPYMPREREKIGNYFSRILAVKPGITGLWQVSGRNKLTFRQRLERDVWYIQNWSLWLDIIIILKTIKRFVV